MTTLNRIYEERTRIALSKWGIHRFNFDENTGNALDGVGNSVGTVNGATRVDGWNGEGKAVSFNGTNQNILFNDTIIPIGAKTVVFYFKKSTQNPNMREVLMTNNLTTNGLTVYFHFNGTLVFDISNSANNRVFAVGVPISNYIDGQWHRVMMSFDGTLNTNGVKIYIDEQREPFVQATASNLEYFINSNLSMGYNPNASNTQFANFNGEIDDFQVYNRNLKPSDFDLNKNLILYNGVYQSYDNGWQNVSNDTPTVEQFLESGIDSLTPLLDRVNGYSPLDELNGEYTIVNWTDEINSERVLDLDVTQSPQLVYANSDISLAGVESVDSISLTASGNTKVAISFDSGLTYQVFRNGIWNTIEDASDGMSISEINSLTGEQINLGKGESNFIRFSYYLAEDSIVDRIVLSVTLQGQERILPSSDYVLSYDYPNKTITYLFNRDMTLSVNYVDG